MNAPAFVHRTVLRDETVAAIAPRDGGLYVDATLGGGGHAEAILSRATCRLLGIDRDQTALAAATARLAPFGDRFTSVHGPFGGLADLLVEGLAKLAPERSQVDGVVADLGVSSPQLDDAARGMSFRREASEAPIDMRMDRSTGRTAAELIEALDEAALADVIFRYGEEHRSRRIARSIKAMSEAGTLKTTGDLRHAVYAAIGGDRAGGTDPATKTFQALRIATNDELGELSRLLGALGRVLAPNGVAAIISFHSLEDAEVKRAFADEATWEPLAKKPVTAGDVELGENPRARSAKLRAARRRAPEEASLDPREARMRKYEAKKARRFGGAG